MSTRTNGAFLQASLAQDSSSNITTWYLPMTHYTGMILVGQIIDASAGFNPDLSGNNGFGYWVPISFVGNSAIGNSVGYYCDTMTVNYNGGGLYPMYGLEFTNVDFSKYNLRVMFGGFIDTTTTFAFTSENPNPNP